MPTENRESGYDLARGLAVFGMVLVNFKFVAGLEGVEDGWLGRAVGLFDGRAAATFVTLAGIGVSLLCRRRRQGVDVEGLKSCRIILLKRAMFLFVLGFFDTFFWVGDILHFYSIYLVIAALLLDATSRRLWAAAVSSIFVFLALFLFLDYEKGWDWEAFKYAGLWRPGGFLRHLFFNGFHPVFPWIAFLLAGLCLGRQDWSGRRAKWALFATGSAIAAAAELASRVLSAWAAAGGGDEAERFALLFGTQAMPPTPLYLIAGGGTAVAVIASCLIIAEKFRDSRWLEPFVATGQMALSLYVAHVAAFNILERIQNPSLHRVVGWAIGFYAVCLAAAWSWRRRFERGPLEAAMRWVSA